MYPELNIHPVESNSLSLILLDNEEEQLQLFLERLNVLRSYIEDKYQNKYSIHLFVNNVEYSKAIQKQYGFEVVELTKNKTEILDFANKNNIDVIYSSNKELILELYQGQNPFELTSVFDEVSFEIESFMTGKDIAWSFNDAVWNATWFSKYNQSDALMQAVMKLLYKYQTKKGSTQVQIDFARALTNKAGHIRHCEEVLTSLVQKKNYSERNNSVINAYGLKDFYDYKFEITYNLGNYYFLISGTIDIIGRLLNKTYRLGGERNIERDEFHTLLVKFNKDLVDLFSEKVTNEWIIWLKTRRNYVAHESNTTYTDILMGKKERAPQSAIDAIVEGLKDWNALAIFADPVRVNYMKEDAKAVVRMYEDSTVYTRDAMSVPWFNKDTDKAELRTFHPLINIRADYHKIEKLLKDTIDILTK